MSRPRKWLAATLLAAALLAVAARPAEAAPPAPGDLRVTAITPLSVTLSWTPSEGATTYQVNYRQAFNDVIWPQAVGNVTTVTITGYISPAREYTFSVSARDAGGAYSPASNSVTVVTPAATTGDTTPPSTPGNLRLTGAAPAVVPLAWDAATDNVAVTGYDVYFFDGWYTSTVVGATTGTAFDAPLRTGYTGSYYYVRAKDAAGNVSIASNTVRVVVTTPTTPPPAPVCQVAYRTTSEWRGGFVAEVTATNLRATTVDGWTLVFAFGGDQRVTSSWNATFQQTGSTVTLTGERWNRTIPAGGTVTAGLLGRWSASDAPPTSATLNGSACRLD